VKPLAAVAALCVTGFLAASWAPQAGIVRVLALLLAAGVAAFLLPAGPPFSAAAHPPACPRLGLVAGRLGRHPEVAPDDAVSPREPPLPGAGLVALGLVACGMVLHGRHHAWLGLGAWAMGLPILYGLGSFVPDAPAWCARWPGKMLALLAGVVFVCLLPPFWTTPRALYNWEDYTVAGLLGTYRGEYRPDATDVPHGMLYSLDRLLQVSVPWNAGLMTDSYRVLLGGTPAALAMRAFGINLFGLRLYSVLSSLAAIALLVRLTRRVAPTRPGLGWLAGILMAPLPVFLVYGRTATDVAPTVAWALVILLLAAGVVWSPGRSWRTAFALGAAISLSVYFYAVIRLQVIGVLLWLSALWLSRRFRPGARAAAAMLAGFVLLCLPQAFTADEIGIGLMQGRGEQLISMSAQPDELRQAFPGQDLQLPPRIGLRLSFMLRYFWRNLGDWYRLFAGVDTQTPASDYWNPHGEILPPLLMALALCGFALSWKALGRGRAAFLAMVFVFGACPSLLTNNVHAGRVLLALPALVIWMALASAAGCGWLRLVAGSRPWAASLALGALLSYCVWLHHQGFVRPMRNEHFPHRAWQGPLADVIAPLPIARAILSPMPVEAPGVQFFLFPTHRLWLEGRPLVPLDRGPQPGPGRVSALAADCADAPSPLIPLGAGPIFVPTGCARRWLGSGIEMSLSVPGGEFVGILEAAEASRERTGRIWVSDLAAKDVAFGFAPPRMNTTYADTPIVMDGLTYLHGIGMHSWCRMTVDVPPNAVRFTAVIGLGDDGRVCGESQAAVSFRVSAPGGVALFDSGRIDARMSSRRLELQLHGEPQLTLEVTEGGNGRDCDHASWGDAAFWTTPAAAASELR
jgi:NPCBM/NEW2 domain